MLKTLNRLFQPKQILPTFAVGDETFPYLEVHTSKAISPVLFIGLHGFGSDETQIATLVNLELDTPFVYLAPRAWYTLTDGGYAWFPLTQEGETFKVDKVQYRESMGLLEAFIQAAAQHYGAREVYLVGYSQGAGLSLSYFLHKSETITGAIAMSGTLLPEMKPAELVAINKPLFVGHGTLDTLISAEERAELKRYLAQHNVSLTYREYAVPHVVSQEEKRDVQRWLSGVIHPRLNSI